MNLQKYKDKSLKEVMALAASEFEYVELEKEGAIAISICDTTSPVNRTHVFDVDCNDLVVYNVDDNIYVGEHDTIRFKDVKCVFDVTEYYNEDDEEEGLLVIVLLVSGVFVKLYYNN